MEPRPTSRWRRFRRNRRAMASVVALAVLFTLLIIGFDPVLGAIAGWGVPSCVIDALSSCSLLKHYMSLGRGVLDFADVGYYVGMIVFMLAAAQCVTDCRKAS